MLLAGLATWIGKTAYLEQRRRHNDVEQAKVEEVDIKALIAAIQKRIAPSSLKEVVVRPKPAAPLNSLSEKTDAKNVETFWTALSN
jgi:predicted Zn-dependent peptidase